MTTVAIISLIIGGSGLLGIATLIFLVGKWTEGTNKDIGKLQSNIASIKSTLTISDTCLNNLENKISTDILEYKKILLTIDSKWSTKLENLYKTLTGIIEDSKYYQRCANDRFDKIENRIIELERRIK